MKEVPIQVLALIGADSIATLTQAELILRVGYYSVGLVIVLLTYFNSRKKKD